MKCKFCQNFLYVDVPAGCQNFDFRYTFFFPNYHPSVYQFHTKTTQFCAKLGAFYDNLLKVHPMYVNWVPLCVRKTPQYAVPKFAKSTPKGRHIGLYIYHVDVRTFSGIFTSFVTVMSNKMIFNNRFLCLLVKHFFENTQPFNHLQIRSWQLTQEILDELIPLKTTHPGKLWYHHRITTCTNIMWLWAKA